MGDKKTDVKTCPITYWGLIVTGNILLDFCIGQEYSQILSYVERFIQTSFPDHLVNPLVIVFELFLMPYLCLGQGDYNM